MQYTRIDMPEHAITEMMTVEQRTEFDNIIRQMLGRHTGVLRKRQRFSLPFGITQQTDGFLAHIINTLDTSQISANLVANHTAFFITYQAIKAFAQRTDLSFNQVCIISGELNNVQSLHVFAFNVGDVITNAVPDNVFSRQIQYFGIDGFNR
ncbi:hypothetical protein SRABI106_03016 [Rahnella aquatilis]|nr:hypothetical protein SRABI106_03016 [Rahnella aquatilis]